METRSLRLLLGLRDGRLLLLRCCAEETSFGMSLWSAVKTRLQMFKQIGKIFKNMIYVRLVVFLCVLYAQFNLKWEIVERIVCHIF